VNISDVLAQRREKATAVAQVTSLTAHNRKVLCVTCVCVCVCVWRYPESVAPVLRCGVKVFQGSRCVVLYSVLCPPRDLSRVRVCVVRGLGVCMETAKVMPRFWGSREEQGGSCENP
jgi:hypothetical protein